VRVLALATHPEGAASTRYRIVQFLPSLAREGVEVHLAPLLTSSAFARLYRRGALASKTRDWLRAWGTRWAHVGTAARYDAILVHREIWPLRGLILERRLLERNPRWLFDFDDAIYVADVSDANRGVAFLKDAQKPDWIARHARAVSAGSPFLRSWAAPRLPSSARAFLVPTVIDTRRWTPAVDSSGDTRRRGVVLGWIGSHTTVFYLDVLRPALRALALRYPDLRLRVIGAEFHDRGVNVENVPWSLDGEIDALRGIDIGLAPLPDTERARGKCGLKLLQYMSLAKPAVVSPVGVHHDIVAEGENGLFAQSTEQWVEALSRLIEDQGLRRGLGEAGRLTVEERYSVRSAAPRLCEALHFVASGA
jgi:glycosyltransferase involved in cell wall biosynthesis